MVTEVMLITGASSGIGADLARVAARNGQDLILVARREDALNALKEEIAAKHNVNITVLPCDLSDPDGATRLHEQVTAGGHVVTFLVNNAGFGVHGEFLNEPVADHQKQNHVNVLSLLSLCHLFGNDMKAAGRGRILNVASTASFQPIPIMSTYAAGKAYVRSLSEALAAELRGSGVTVTCLCPGVTDTGFFEVADMKNLLMFRLGMQTSMAVAEFGFAAAMAGKGVVVSGLMNRMLAFTTRFSPTKLNTWIARRLVTP